jgi:hypothetical protein
VADIFQADQSAIGIALEDDVIELRGFGKTADGANADLELLAGNRGLGADLSGGDFDVLLLESIDHIVGGEAAAGHADGIEPETHGVFALAEDEDVGNAGNALQRVADIDVEVIAHEERGVAAVGREDGAAEDEILRGLGDGDSDLLDGGGEASGSGVDAVLDVNRGEVGIAVESKVAVMVLTPSLVLDEVMYFMPSAPLICCSSGVVTADSTVCELAPV